MKHFLLLTAILVFIVGCAPIIEQIIGHTDFNPVFEWDPAMAVYAVPNSNSVTEPNIYKLESKLSRILTLAGNTAGLKFVEDSDLADVQMLVKYQIDTVSVVSPAQHFSSGGSVNYYSPLTKMIFGNSRNYSVTMPSYEYNKTYLTVSLWLTEKKSSFFQSSSNNETRMVSHIKKELGEHDHNRLTYHLLIACIESIPGTSRNFERHIPHLNAILDPNWLGGILVGSSGEGIQSGVVASPFKNRDVIFQINGKEVQDYFDYRVIMLELPDNTKTITFSINRRGHKMETDCRLSWN